MNLDQEFLARLQRIAEAGIQLLPTPQLPNHFVFERDGFVVLVERRGEALGQIGSPGLLNPKGFGALVDRAGESYFVWKAEERMAQPREALSARSLLHDLKRALR
jgi:hypothetical protein